MNHERSATPSGRWLAFLLACSKGNAPGQVPQPPPIVAPAEAPAGQPAPSSAHAALVTPLETAKYAGYLFSYFLGERTAQGEQIYFALSRGNDPLHWQELHRGEPVLTSSVGTRGVRDPFILRSPDGARFYLIATDLKVFGDGNWDRAQRQGSKSIVVWESSDLVTWSEPRLVQVSAGNAGNTWAPEAFYDARARQYLVFWASKLYADAAHTGDSYNRIVSATTLDFRTFSEPLVWYDPGHSVIDSTVITLGDVFYRFTKDERANSPSNPCGKFIRVETSRALTNPRWDALAECIGRGVLSRGEGPLVFKSNTEQKWYLFIDEFGGRGYVPFESTDLSSGQWVPSPDYSLPTTLRHGTVLPVTAAEYERLSRAFGPG